MIPEYEVEWDGKRVSLPPLGLTSWGEHGIGVSPWPADRDWLKRITQKVIDRHLGEEPSAPCPAPGLMETSKPGGTEEDGSTA